MARRLVAILLLLTCAAAAAAAKCDPCTVASQIFRFCPEPNSRAVCCDVVTTVMDAGHDDDPACLCKLDECPEYLFTGYSLEELVRLYAGCDGERLGDALQLAQSCNTNEPRAPLAVSP